MLRRRIGELVPSAALQGRAGIAFAAAAAVAIIIGTTGCVSEHGPRHQAAPLVHGNDDRQEYFEVSDPLVRSTISRSIVALIPRDQITQTGELKSPPSLDDIANLCSGEPYAEQPAAALCTGVLVDWDLVLTAGHCVRAIPLAELVVTFGYYFKAPGQLAIAAGSTIDVQEIAAEALSHSSDETRIDYAWLRLKYAAAAPYAPVSIRTRLPQDEESVLSIGAGASLPIKADAGGVVRDARAHTRDYFIADTDTSAGSSGGSAFDTDLNLIGILARGGTDFETTDAGCTRMRHVEDGARAEEHFTYVSRALEGLCEADPRASSLCRTDCGDPCRALTPPATQVTCAAALSRRPHRVVQLVSIFVVVLWMWRSVPFGTAACRWRKRRKQCGC